jgi:23S rRNA pseudouridine2605 synthase
VRLQKYLSRAGVASRRGAESLIRDGRVRVNGEVAREMGVKVTEADRVEVDGRVVEPESPTWILLHKPTGYVTTRDDPRGRPTVYDLLPERFHGLFHVGRLDQDSAGLLLFTNEGGIANRLMHPRYQVDRVYVVEVEGAAGSEVMARLTAGVELEDGPARAESAEIVESGTGGSPRTRARLVLREGRKREVRRMFDAVGHPVRRLRRERLGPIELGDLGEGEWRKLERAEVRSLRELGGR